MMFRPEVRQVVVTGGLWVKSAFRTCITAADREDARGSLKASAGRAWHGCVQGGLWTDLDELDNFDSHESSMKE